MAACIILTPQIQLAFGGGILSQNSGNKSPFTSGYDRGCDDAQISDPSDRYINKPGKGPGFHTPEFMRGYDNGFDACSNPYYQPQQPRTQLPQASSVYIAK
jgi:hypothetical protein